MKKIDTIRIRMYHTGSVGDCFLLLFEKSGTVTFSMLIDCGGFMTKKEAITKCVEDIRGNIVDNTLDLVVVTHEHLDHVSGFNQAKTVFDKIKFKQVWMSWAENEADPLAKKLFKEKGKKLKALKDVVKDNLQQITQQLNAPYRQVGFKRSLKMRKENFSKALALLEFEEGEMKGAKKSLKISDAMKYVKGKCVATPKSKMFKKPGEVYKDLKGAEGVKFHILGPPYHSDLHGIKDDMDHDQMYSLAARLGLGMNDFNFNAIASRNDAEIPLVSPFHKKYHMDDKETRKFNRTLYNIRHNKWRQIEYDWLDEAGELSIALTDYVNNTSLAMAIEIESTGQVLLFPADAQSGNWKSWHDKEVSDELMANGGSDTATLLKKTIFYKVGHHGSHNGTASGKGMEMMEEKKIIAFMPLVQDKVPEAWGGSKNFPAKKLYKKIIEKTKGAVIRTDLGLIDENGSTELLKKHYSTTEIKKMKEASASGLYHEWVVEV